jgi:hypothetical protein
LEVILKILTRYLTRACQLSSEDGPEGREMDAAHEFEGFDPFGSEPPGLTNSSAQWAMKVSKLAGIVAMSMRLDVSPSFLNV